MIAKIININVIMKFLSIIQYWGAWATINLVSGWFLIWPLTSDEIKRQMDKRAALGKFNYSLSMLDLDVDRKEWAEELEKKRKGDADKP